MGPARTDHLRPLICAVEVPGPKTEGRKRTVYVEESAWWLVEAAAPCQLGYGEPWRHRAAACASAGVENVTIHDLRHCSGQWATEGGADEGALQHPFGHATRQVTERFTRRANQGPAVQALSMIVMPFVRR